MSKRKRCTWPVIILILVLMIVAGLLIWLFVPFSSAVKKIVPFFNQTNAPEPTPAPTPSLIVPTNAPTVSPTVTPGFQFRQCSPSAQNCCNGLENLCDFPVNEVMFATVHNAMADRGNGFVLLPNQNRPLEEALEEGYRALNLDVCNCGGNHVFCHGLCQTGQRAIDEVLTNIVSFLVANPTEVVLLPIELNSEAEQPVDIMALSNILQNVTNAQNMLYIHDQNATAWPTLQTLINDNKRILLFHYNGPTCANPGECPQGFHYWWDYAVETEFSFDNVNALLDTSTSCTITRGAGGTRDFFGVNNFVRVPNEQVATNLATSAFLDTRIEACSNANNLGVNLVLVDFWDIGDLLEVVQTRNAALGGRGRKLRGR